MTRQAPPRQVACRLPIGPFLAAALLAVASGCSLSPKWTYPPDLASGLYRRAELKYQIHGIEAPAPTPATQLASYQVQPGASAAMANPHTRHTLTIHYPHPHNIPGMARAIVIEEAVQPEAAEHVNPWLDFTAMLGRGGEPKARVVGGRTLDIPKAELDQMLAVMRNQGFYTPTEYEPGRARLGTEMDGVTLSKSWDRIPELEQLVQRIRVQGQPLTGGR